MTKFEMYEKIQTLKHKGFSKRRAARQADVSRGTVDKYWDMSEDEYAQCLIESKSRTKILDLYQGFIETQIRQYPEITGAIIHDHLMEAYPELDVSARCSHKNKKPTSATQKKGMAILSVRAILNNVCGGIRESLRNRIRIPKGEKHKNQ